MNEKLLQLMLENPNTEVIPMVYWESNDGEHSISTSKIQSIDYKRYAIINGMIIDERDFEEAINTQLEYEIGEHNENDVLEAIGWLEVKEAIFISIG